MEIKDPWDVPGATTSTANAAPAEKMFPEITRKHVKAGLGLGALALVGALTVMNRGAIGNAIRSGSSSVADTARGLTHTGSVIPETPNNVERVSALERDIDSADDLEVRMATYMNQHPNFAQEDAFRRMFAQRRQLAEGILNNAAVALDKPTSTTWGNHIESLWGTPKGTLLTVKLLSGIAFSLHRTARNGDTSDQEGARVVNNMFSQDGWQRDTGLVSDRRDPNSIHYGLLARLERDNLVSFSLARSNARTTTPGAYELVSEPQYLQAMRARLQRIQAAIEAKRSAGQLTQANVLAELNSEAVPQDALAQVPMNITLSAVWPRLNAVGSTIDTEVLAQGLLGGRPYLSVLLVSDGQGGGVTRAHELNPAEVPDPRTFVPIAR